MNYWPLVLVTLVTLATSPARAVSLSFEAAPGCPSREEFVSSIERRAGSLEASNSAAKRAFDVVIRHEGSAYVGTLTADSGVLPRGDERKVQASTCADVAEALAIALAVALQGEHAAPEPPVLPARKSEAPAVTAPEPRTTTFRAASRWGHHGDGKLHFDPKFAITLYAGASFGTFPMATARYDATFRMASFVTLPSGEQSIIGPILRARLGFIGAPQQSYDQQGTTLAISGQSLGLGLCWSPHYHADGLVLLGCGELGLAGYASHAENRDGAKRDSAVTLLGTIGPVLEAEYSLGPLQLGGRLGGNLVFGRFDAPGIDGKPLLESKRWEAFLMLGVGGHW